MKLVPSRAYLKIQKDAELCEIEGRKFIQATATVQDLEPKQEGVFLIVSSELIHHISSKERPDVFAIDWRGVCYQTS